MKTYHFLSGLPRSGSTVLASILNQNPMVYVTPTSPMLDLLIENQDAWHKLPSVRANPIPEQLTNVTRAMINAMWQHRPEPIIIDKNRGWGKNMPASTILFERDIKVVATFRDLPSIMASWLTLIKKNPGNHVDQLITQRGAPINDANRMGEMWHNMTRDCMESLKQLKSDAGDRLLLIHYDDLIRDPLPQLESIGRFLDLPHHAYDIDNIKNDTNDDDLAAWGFDGMHRIRSSLSKTARPAQEVLGQDLYDRFRELEKKYE